MARILLVEDELHLAEGLCFNLEADGYEVELVDTGEQAVERLQQPAPGIDLVVLDVMLPGMDGFSVVSLLRGMDLYQPVLLLTARSRPEDMVRGFAAGADDYLPKPFELPVLLARINSLLRRRNWLRQDAPAEDRAEPYAFAGRLFDYNARTLHVQGRTQPLTLMEANLLRYLVQHAGQAVPRKTLLEEVWGMREDTDTRAIDAFIVRLRRYIEDEPARPRHLLTVRGTGYRFVPE